jgi:hypothetical protein
MHLVGFIIRKYHDARSSECQIHIAFTFTQSRPMVVALSNLSPVLPTIIQ